jgi:hypothetical protein
MSGPCILPAWSLNPPAVFFSAAFSLSFLKTFRNWRGTKWIEIRCRFLILTSGFCPGRKYFMSRAWPMACEAFLHHTLSRTNEGHDIFVDDDHRYQFLTTLGQMMDRLAD